MRITGSDRLLVLDGFPHRLPLWQVVEPEQKVKLFWSLKGVLGFPLLWSKGGVGDLGAHARAIATGKVVPDDLKEGEVIEVKDPTEEPRLEMLIVRNPNGTLSPAEVLVYEKLEVV